MELTNKQLSRLIGAVYSDPQIQKAIEAVLIGGMSIYRAEQLFEQKHKTLGYKINRVKKQIELITFVMGK